MRVLALATAVLLAACAAPAPPAAPAASSSPAGSYVLVEMDGKPLTAETEAEPGWILRAATITLVDNGRMTLEIVAHRRGAAQTQTRSMEGAWTQKGNELVLTLAPAGPGTIVAPMTGTLEGGRLSFHDPSGRLATFQRR